MGMEMVASNSIKMQSARCQIGRNQEGYVSNDHNEQNNSQHHKRIIRETKSSEKKNDDRQDDEQEYRGVD